MLREQPQHSEQSEEAEDAQDHQYPHSSPGSLADFHVGAQARDDGVGDARGERHSDDAKVHDVEPRLAAEEYLWPQGEYSDADLEDEVERDPEVDGVYDARSRSLGEAPLGLPLDDGAGHDERDVDDDEEEREDAEGDLLHEVPQGQVPDVLLGAPPGRRAARIDHLKWS